MGGREAAVAVKDDLEAGTEIKKGVEKGIKIEMTGMRIETGAG